MSCGMGRLDCVLVNLLRQGLQSLISTKHPHTLAASICFLQGADSAWSWGIHQVPSISLPHWQARRKAASLINAVDKFFVGVLSAHGCQVHQELELMSSDSCFLELVSANDACI